MPNKLNFSCHICVFIFICCLKITNAQIYYCGLLTANHLYDCKQWTNNTYVLLKRWHRTIFWVHACKDMGVWVCPCAVTVRWNIF